LEPQRSETEDAWVTLATLGRVWGRRGELAAESLTSGPGRFDGVQQVYLFGPGDAGQARPIELESVWEHRGRLVFSSGASTSISDAEPLQGAEVRLPRGERAPLTDGEFYQSDLIGCQVVERSTGEPLGSVVGWVEHSGPPLIEVRGEGKAFSGPLREVDLRGD